MLRERAGDKAPREGKSFEMTFDRLIASLYMTAMMQLGLMAPEGEQPRADILGARQTIDTLSVLAEKTKGNLTEAEQNMPAKCPLRGAHGLSPIDQHDHARSSARQRDQDLSMKATLTVLGSGTSMGVPRWGVIAGCAIPLTLAIAAPAHRSWSSTTSAWC